MTKPHKVNQDIYKGFRPLLLLIIAVCLGVSYAENPEAFILVHKQPPDILFYILGYFVFDIGMSLSQEIITLRGRILDLEEKNKP